MQSSVQRYLSLFFVLLATLSCYQAAPSNDKKAVEPSASKVEQLVRVYPINEEQYEKLLKLTNGKNVISEARLTSAGFTAVRNSLDNGWNSLLRIMGLTTTSRSEVAKIDIDGQPLCVMKRSLSDVITDSSEPRGLESKAVSDEDSVINCIVVLKKDPAHETQAAVNNPSFAPYWYHENNAAVVPEQQQSIEPVAPLKTVAQPAQVADESDEERQVATTTPAPKVNKQKPKAKPKSKPKSKQQKQKTAEIAGASRQYGGYGIPPPPPPPPLSPYGSPYGGAYPYGGFNQNPYDAFNPYSSYGAQPGYGQFPSFGPQSFYPPSQYYGPPSPYNPYYEQTAELEHAEEEEEEDEDEEAYEVEGEVDESYENEYYH